MLIIVNTRHKIEPIGLFLCRRRCIIYTILSCRRKLHWRNCTGVVYDTQGFVFGLFSCSTKVEFD